MTTSLEDREREALQRMTDALDMFQLAQERVRRLEREWRRMAVEIEGLHRRIPMLEARFRAALAEVDAIQAQMEHDHPSDTTIPVRMTEISMGV